MHPSFFLSRHFVTFVSNDVLIFTGGAYDEGPNESLHGPRAAGGSSQKRAETTETGLRELEA